MPKHRGPAWWLLSALVPLLAGLFVVEHRAALPPGWHTAVRVGIALFIYGLVWLWLRANAVPQLWSDQGTDDRERVIEARGAASRSPGARFTPSQADIIDIRARHRHRRVKPQVNGREIRKCSRNFDRRSSWW
jgi:hypothetical protein